MRRLRKAFTINSIIVWIVVVGIIGGVTGPTTYLIVNEARKNRAVSAAIAINSAKATYSTRVPNADDVWNAAASDDARYALLKGAGLLDLQPNNLTGAGGFTPTYTVLSLGATLSTRCGATYKGETLTY